MYSVKDKIPLLGLASSIRVIAPDLIRSSDLSICYTCDIPLHTERREDATVPCHTADRYWVLGIFFKL